MRPTPALHMRPTLALWGQGSDRGLSRQVPSRKKAMFRNMVSSLLEHERIETTLPKAKEAQVHAERMITLAKKGSLLHKRKALAFVRGETLVHKLFHELAARYAARPGGYTRVVRTRRRYGDNAQMAFLELVDGPNEPTKTPLCVFPLPLPSRPRQLAALHSTASAHGAPCFPPGCVPNDEDLSTWKCRFTDPATQRGPQYDK